ncbi:hypothetical protein GRF29_96g507853 [Pseudopithomyces chartarum]|uniref:Uncharacterized protein n=1 Tax=Pseudopithomyces chartarum TaxID=1892770 RepID=A0AAN6RGG8_9PLEO|nr:hypothetical protein GRF29_96g507853 [Pseudopithomyces chartarum]
MPSFIVSTALAAILTVVPYAAAQLPNTGNITLFSDTSCAERVFANSWTLGSDFCGIIDSSASWSTDAVYQSYVLNERPWCINGSRPYFNVYRDETCSDLIHSYEPGPLYNPTGPDSDGTCVAPGRAFKAVAFICDGFPGAWGMESSMPSSSAERESANPSSTDSPTLTVSEATSRSSAVVVTSAAVSSSGTSESVATESSTYNSTATATSTVSSMPTPAFDGSASSFRVYQALPIALVLFALGLLA